MPSTIPAAIAGLVTLCRNNVTNADVYDGPPVGGDHADWIGVGYDPVGGSQVVTADTSWAALGARKQDERFEITCTLGSTSGEVDIAARRARAYALLDAIAAAIVNDVTLGGAVRVAHVSSHSLLQELDEQGLTAGVRFVVSCQSRI